MVEINQNLELAIQASLKAGEEIMKIYDDGFEVEIKQDNSPLTRADKAASRIINSILSPTNIPCIDEEARQLPFSERKHWEHCWIVDPLDGTKEFIKRNGEFTVNIALVKNGNPICGVIYVPAFKTLYVADVKGKLAFKSQLESHRVPLEELKEKAVHISPDETSNTLKVVGSRSHMNEETTNFINGLKKNGNDVEIVSKGSSLKFCLVAEGSAHIYPRFAPTMEWDTAAGQALCNAVGVEVISTKTNKPLQYNKEDLLNPWFIVAKDQS